MASNERLIQAGADAMVAGMQVMAESVINQVIERNQSSYNVQLIEAARQALDKQITHRNTQLDELQEIKDEFGRMVEKAETALKPFDPGTIQLTEPQLDNVAQEVTRLLSVINQEIELYRFHFFSEIIHSAGYDPETETVFVKLNNGEKYKYFNVPKKVAKEFLTEAPSVGRYFNTVIKANYYYEHIT